VLVRVYIVCALVGILKKIRQSLIQIIQFHIPVVPNVLLNSLLHLAPALPITVSLLPQICVVNFMATNLLTHTVVFAA
jgi:hypothetical protein